VAVIVVAAQLFAVARHQQERAVGPDAEHEDVGIGYTVADLVAIFRDLEVLDSGPQQKDGGGPNTFTQPFLTAALFRDTGDR